MPMRVQTGEKWGQSLFLGDVCKVVCPLVSQSLGFPRNEIGQAIGLAR